MSLSTVAGYCALMALSAVAVFWLCGRAARFALSWSRRRAMRAIIRERQSAFLPPNPAREEAKRALEADDLYRCSKCRGPNFNSASRWLCHACDEVARKALQAVEDAYDKARADPLQPEWLHSVTVGDVAADGMLVLHHDTSAVRAHDGLSYLSDWASGTVTASNGTTSTTTDALIDAQIDDACGIPPAPPFEVSPIAYLYPRLCSAMGCGDLRTTASVYCETHARAAERST